MIIVRAVYILYKYMIYLFFIIDLLKINYLIISETNDSVAMGVPKINEVQIKSVSLVIHKNKLTLSFNNSKYELV